MSAMAKYARIFSAQPTDDEVGKRNRAVAAIMQWMEGLQPVSHVVEVAASLADCMGGGSLSDEIIEVVERAIVEAGSEAFVRNGKELEIAVCSFVAALGLVRQPLLSASGWTPTDAMAAGLWSALSFQSPNSKEALEVLRQDMIVAARERVMAVAEASRVRAPVPEVGLLQISESTPNGVRSKTAFKTAVEPLVKALRENAELDREEIEFLWWAMSDWSDTLQRPVSDVDGAARAVTAGIDGAMKLRKLPASGHRHVVLKDVPSGGDVSLAAVIESIGDNATKLSASFDADWMGKAASVFPLLNAIASGEAKGPGSEVARPARIWGERAMLEAGILQVDGRKAG